MRTTSRRFLRGIVITAAVAALMVPSAALAKGGPPDGAGNGGGRGVGNGGGSGGRGGGGGPGEETAGNNLSVPVVFTNGTTGSFTVTCGTDAMGDLVKPDDQTPLTGYPVSPGDYYYVQGVNTWQAQCQKVDSSTQVYASVAWGDNFGDASLTTRHPIRVEVVLTSTADSSDPTSEAISGTGFTVVKLEPNALDRESAYGTLATGDLTTGFISTAESMTALVFDPLATLTITNSDGEQVVNGLAGAEINATGKIVYGYNLRVTEPGTYTITFAFSDNVHLTGNDIGGITDHTATVPIEVLGGGGGGGGGHGH